MVKRGVLHSSCSSRTTACSLQANVSILMQSMFTPMMDSKMSIHRRREKSWTAPPCTHHRAWPISMFYLSPSGLYIRGRGLPPHHNQQMPAPRTAAKVMG